ncbi:kinase-like domain-containing protein [Xylariomycetidae sp. FL0641]|nr:kinase-like domain-containing protein [Xylariomycetidae sp. FL0641]
MADWLMTRIAISDRFQYYRRGLPYDPRARRQQNFAGVTLHQYRPHDLPPGATIPPDRVNQGVQPTSRPIVTRGNLEAILDPAYNPGPPDPSLARARDTVQSLKNENFNFGSRIIRYSKCMGWGGQGLVAHFNELWGDGAWKRTLAVKVPFDHDGHLSLQRERTVMHRLRDSEHIVQLLDPDPNGDIPGTRPIHGMIMEMAENGDLAQFIAKVRSHNSRIPNTILWRFFLCFIRMAIGLAYPVRALPQNNDRQAPIRETIPQEGRDPLTGNDHITRLVHFDINPANVFVFDMIHGPSAEEHGISPLLKLGDFGLTEEVMPNQDDRYYERLRMKGKAPYYAPEQFAAEWDHIEKDKGLVATNPLAGNYSAHTNIWAIGQVGLLINQDIYIYIHTHIHTSQPANPHTPHNS